ncbi:MAG: hypothetical protein IKC82_02190 [Lentisphaeria bacterium]|nr:hypothetical protein [Lentisphaeria bacterium]
MSDQTLQSAYNAKGKSPGYGVISGGISGNKDGAEVFLRSAPEIFCVHPFAGQALMVI